MSNTRRFNFNMMELVLSVVVLSAAAAVILILVASGSRSGREAVEENAISDAAEYVSGVYRSVIAGDLLSAQHSANTSGSALPAERTYQAWKTILPETFNESDLTNSDWAAQPVAGTQLTAKTIDSLKYRVYKYERIQMLDAEKSVDFSAMVRVWAEEMPLAFRDWTANNGEAVSLNGSQAGLTANNYALRLMMELSWPLDVAYPSREKRVFVVDMIDPIKEL